jgi:hypothetical protein
VQKSEKRKLSKCFYDTSTDIAMRAACYSSFIGDGLDLSDVSYKKHSGDERFTWFRPPERNTLRPRENENCIAVCCLSVGFTLGFPGSA